MAKRLLSRGRFLTAGFGFLGMAAFLSQWSSGIAKPFSCKDRAKPEGDKSPQKFLHAFTGKKFKDLPTNPVSY